MAFDHEKFQKYGADVATGLVCVAELGFAAYAIHLIKEPIKQAWRRHKLNKAIKSLEKCNKDLLIAENCGLKKENEELLRKNQELVDQIPKAEEA